MFLNPQLLHNWEDGKYLSTFIKFVPFSSHLSSSRFISVNQRDFNEDGEKALKSIAEKFNAEYVKEANLNYNWNER